jgi:hypothetical protein
MRYIYRRLNILHWFFLSLFALGASSVMAQTGEVAVSQWQRLLGPYYSAYPMQVARAYDNGYAISYVEYVFRLSESGSTIWQTSIPDTPNLPGYRNTPTYITSTPDGGFAVLVKSSIKWSLARLDATGAVLWIKPFADNLDNQSNSSLSFTNLIYTTDTGFMVVGVLSIPRGGSYTEIYKFDSSGNNTQRRTISASNRNGGRPAAVASRVIQTGDNNYLLVGRASDPVNVTITLKAWAIKIDQQLNTIWEKYTGGQILDDVIQSPYANDSAIAVGTVTGTETSSYTITANGDVTQGASIPNRVNGTQSFIVADTKSTSHTIVDVVNERQGDFRLQSIRGQEQGRFQKIGGSSGESVLSIVASNDGGYLVVGVTTSTDGDVQGKTNADPSVWLVKLAPFSTREVYSVQSGNWNNPSVWSCNCIPTADNNVTIKQNHVIVLDSTMPQALCQQLAISGTFSILGSSILVNGVKMTN